MNPQEFGSDKKNILVSTKKRLKKENQKLKQQNKEMEMKLIEEEKSHFETIKMIEKQHVESEMELCKEKEVDRETMEKFIKGEIHACCENNICEGSRKFQDAISKLSKDNEFARKSQNIITNFNIRFMRDTIQHGIKVVKNHKLETILPFYIQRTKKLDYLVSKGEVNRRKDLFFLRMTLMKYIMTLGTNIQKSYS